MASSIRIIALARLRCLVAAPPLARALRSSAVAASLARPRRQRNPVPVRARTSKAVEEEWQKEQLEQDKKIDAQIAAVKKEVAARLAAAAAAGVTADASGLTGDDRAAAARLGPAIRDACARLGAGLVERETEVRLLLLAALCGEHLLLLGPPGTAKSELGRRLARLCSGAYFERLLTRFSVPEELFGPLSMSALEADRYERQTAGYLPTASVAFIDEIFKANSAILNSLLTILNERAFDNGAGRERVPLLCLVAASNELPESEELDALYDRFLLRASVTAVSDRGLPALLRIADAATDGAAGASAAAPPAGGPAVDVCSLAEGALGTAAVAGARARALAAVSLPAGIVALLGELRTALQKEFEPPVVVSDRRLVKAVALLKVSAFTCGRSSINELDCLLLQHVLWNRPEERPRLRDWLLKRASRESGGQQARFLVAGLFGRACRIDPAADAGAAAAASARLAAEAAQLAAVIAGQQAAVMGGGGGSLATDLKSHLWLSAPEADAAAAALAPVLTRARAAAGALLSDVVTLQTLLDKRVEPHVMAVMLPSYWSDFIRNAPVQAVRGLGLDEDEAAA